MAKLKFYRSFIITLILLVLSLCLIHGLPEIVAFKDLSVIGTLFFSILSIVIYCLGERLGRSKNRNLFSHLIVYNLMLKIFISFIILVLYYKFKAPESNYFIVPFAVIYLAFTIFETYFLSYQARLDRAKE